MSGTGGSAGNDGGIDAGDPERGRLRVSVADVTGMTGKQLAIEVQRASTRAPVGGACLVIDDDPFRVDVDITAINSVGVCDYGDDATIPVGNYVVVVRVQEVDTPPAILCGRADVTVESGVTATVAVDSLTACTPAGFGDGDYVGGPWACSASGDALSHTQSDTAASIMDFKGASISATRAGNSWVERYSDDDCELSIARTIIADLTTPVAIRLSTERVYTWTPSNCSLTVTAGGVDTEVDASFEGLQATTVARFDDMYFHQSSGAGYRFTTVPDVWTYVTPMLAVPCAEGEALARTWTLR